MQSHLLVPEWVSWWSFITSVAGAILTAVAFWFTFREARSAKNRAASAQSAAEQALEAANQAKEAISEKVTIADLTAIRSLMTSIVMLLDVKKFELAAHSVRQSRERLIELCERPRFDARRTEVQELLVGLSQLQETIEKKLWSDPGSDLSLAEISKVLTGYSDRLSAWAEQIRFN
jgi:ribosomal protein L17